MIEAGQRLFVLSGFVVEEGEVYEQTASGELWIRREGRMGQRYRKDQTYDTLEEACARSKSLREKHIQALLREVGRLAINTNVKVRLLKRKQKKAP